MTNPRGFMALGSSAIDDNNRQWVEVLPTTEKTRNGPFYATITEGDLEVYAQSIRDSNGHTVVDYDHEGNAQVGGSTRASGWFTGEAEVRNVDDRGPILCAEIEWTPVAAQQIRDGEFKFISAEYSFENKDKKSGLLTKAKEIIAATLTNRPFYTELAALATEGDVVWETKQGSNTVEQKLSAALNNDDPDSWRYWVSDIDIAGKKALVNDTTDATTWVVPFTFDGETVTPAPTDDWVPAEQEWVAAAAEIAADLASHQPNGGTSASNKGDHVSPEELKALAADLGLAEDASAEDISGAVTALKDKAAEADDLKTENDKLVAAAASAGDENDKTVLVDRARLESLEAEAKLGATARLEQVKTEADALATQAIKDGAIAPASKEAWVTALLPDGATEIVESERAALASLAKGRIPVDERGVAGTSHNDEETALANVRAHLGLVKPTTTEGKAA